MPRSDICGVYVIEQRGADRYYIGSSHAIHRRWQDHRKLLSRGEHHSPQLQNAWLKHGANAFAFYVLEECGPDELLAREQEYLDAFSPFFNVCPEARSRRGAKLTPLQRERHQARMRARAALITHCPAGHEYTPENTYVNKKGKRICRACNAIHVSAIYSRETAEQREERRARVSASHAAHRGTRLAKQADYVATHKDEKRAYDRRRRQILGPALAARRAAKRAAETPEQREQRLAVKRAGYHRRLGQT